MDISALGRLIRRFAGEFVTIVLGILLALWIDGLVSERANRRLEENYLASLTGDLVADSAALVVALTAAERQEAAAAAVLDTLRGDEQPSPEFMMLLFAAGDVRQFEVQDLTLEELRATGSFRLLRNRDLVRRLIEYYEEAELSASDEDMRRRSVLRYLDLAESVVGGGLGNPTVIRRMLDGETGYTLQWYPPPFPISQLRAVVGLEGAVEGVQVLAFGDKERFQALSQKNSALLAMLGR